MLAIYFSLEQAQEMLESSLLEMYSQISPESSQQKMEGN